MWISPTTIASSPLDWHFLHLQNNFLRSICGSLTWLDGNSTTCKWIDLFTRLPDYQEQWLLDMVGVSHDAYDLSSPMLTCLNHSDRSMIKCQLLNKYQQINKCFFWCFRTMKRLMGLTTPVTTKAWMPIEPMHVRNQFGMIVVASKTAYCLAVYEMLIGPAFGIHNNAAWACPQSKKWWQTNGFGRYPNFSCDES